MKVKFILLLSLITFIFSCGHKVEPIESDNGKKWDIIESMSIYIKTMETDVKTFNGKSMTEYKTLAESLTKNIGLLTSNCTMKGKAHDELHNWLLPYIKLVKNFSAAKTEQEAAKYFGEIKNSFTTYNQYFQ